MEQKSFYSGIKVQSSSKCITTIPAIATVPAIPTLPAIPLFQLFHSLEWNRWNRQNTLPVLPIPKKFCIPFTIPLFHLFLFPKIIKRMQSYISFYQTNKNLPCSNPLVGFLAHASMADACTELIELAFETNKLPIDKGICKHLRKTSQDEGRYRHDKITHDTPTQVATNYFK